MNNLRRCIVNGKNAFFHIWITKTRLIPPSALKGGHPGGVGVGTVAIIEYEDGVVDECYPTDIKFVDQPEGNDRVWPERVLELTVHDPKTRKCVACLKCFDSKSTGCVLMGGD